MTGAILGDIAGSRFEFSKPSGFNYKKVELFWEQLLFHGRYGADHRDEIRAFK